MVRHTLGSKIPEMVVRVANRYIGLRVGSLTRANQSLPPNGIYHLYTRIRMFNAVLD
ncbi:MAG: hypothetical protein Ct9H300mP27_05390 [Chloroflexota bacterium]|nr:MAG: hypothetical protein Ct9H300mP27_05390 [Chloroflexota bacterium]